jgi:flagellar basal body-associated protein FliL
MGGNEDDAFLKDIDFGELGESGAIGLDEGRPLPKKVELDIDDMILEDDEEPPETTEPEPVEEAAPEEEPEPAPAKFSRFKMALLAMAAILVLAAVAVPVIIMTRGDKVETETVKPANPLDNLIQAPFVINFPGDKQDIILKMTVAVSFPNQAVQQEFQTQLVVIRDLIFRYALGAGFDSLNDQASRSILSQELAQLINENMKQGTVKSVDIIEIVTM